ncbi:uncharacterized protein LOC129320686 [Prosopis cineraria]|uniref:uncharacterized protein LOC129320686 n=1 Tax=Prosopis cineraria TaxID=364024 RepID=UPI00240F18D4|nr:uncharacterized protein LOC129320686 [Prosopis cineraria]
MRVTPVLCFFLLSLIVLMYSAYGSSLGAESHSQKQPKVMYGMINRSGKQDNQRRYPALHVVRHRTTMKRAKAVYGGANDIRHPRRSSAPSLSIKNSSLFMAAFRDLIFGLLLAFCFY